MAGVVPELRQSNIFDPFPRTGADETAHECFQALVYTFGLAVRLRVVCRTHSKCCMGEAEQLSPELACEDLVAVTDYMCW